MTHLRGSLIDSETKSLLVKDLIVIGAAIGAIVAFYGLVVLISRLAELPLP